MVLRYWILTSILTTDSATKNQFVRALLHGGNKKKMCAGTQLSEHCPGSSASGSSPRVGVCVCALGFLAGAVQSELNSFDEILIRNITISAPFFDQKLIALVNSCNNNRSQGIFEQRSRSAFVISCARARACVCHV